MFCYSFAFAYFTFNNFRLHDVDTVSDESCKISLRFVIVCVNLYSEIVEDEVRCVY